MFKYIGNYFQPKNDYAYKNMVYIFPISISLLISLIKA